MLSCSLDPLKETGNPPKSLAFFFHSNILLSSAFKLFSWKDLCVVFIVCALKRCTWEVIICICLSKNHFFPSLDIGRN